MPCQRKHSMCFTILLIAHLTPLGTLVRRGAGLAGSRFVTCPSFTSHITVGPDECVRVLDHSLFCCWGGFLFSFSVLSFLVVLVLALQQQLPPSPAPPLHSAHLRHTCSPVRRIREWIQSRGRCEVPHTNTHAPIPPHCVFLLLIPVCVCVCACKEFFRPSQTLQQLVSLPFGNKQQCATRKSKTSKTQPHVYISASLQATNLIASSSFFVVVVCFISFSCVV